MFNDKLKQTMNEAGFTAKNLADKAGIAQSSISLYLSGKVDPPDKKKAQLALALGKEADFFKIAEIDETIQVTGYKLPPKVAAKLMGISRDALYQGLQDGRFPFGYAVKMSGKWTYWISAPRFTKETGIPVPASVS
ncbi:helix-turn-helix transcriptional regulator [Oscillospiraceae bacterium 50-58]